MDQEKVKTEMPIELELDDSGLVKEKEESQE